MSRSAAASPTQTRKTAVLNVVGLSPDVLGPETPRLNALVAAGDRYELRPPFPAVTCTSQASMLTGTGVGGHGIVANGWYDRESAEVRFWKQSNALIRGETVYETLAAREPSARVAKLFWWFNMHAPSTEGIETAITPRPIYRADGGKVPDIYTTPMGLRDELQRPSAEGGLGRFPLFKFWGPLAGIESTAWIAACARRVVTETDPALTLVYLPHLDYALQRSGPGSTEAVRAAAEIDAAVGGLVDFLDERGTRVIIVSEYGIEPTAPGGGAVFPNRALREAGLVSVRDERIGRVGGEAFDPGGSRAFAVCDHQCAHVYVDREDDMPCVRDLMERLEGVDRVIDRETFAGGSGTAAHDRAGDLVIEAAEGCWFAHDYWLDDDRAPDFARTVDIHRKPGYDPRELHFDPRLRFPKLAAGRRLIQKKLGMRTLMDVIPLDTSVVKGTHGRAIARAEHRPMLVVPTDGVGGDRGVMPMEGVRDVILESVLGA